MHIIHTVSNGLALDVRQDGRHVREVLVDESLEISASPAITAVTLVDQPGGEPVAISGGTIGPFLQPGAFVFHVDFQDGKAASLRVMACERACLDRIQDPGHVHPSTALRQVEPRPLAGKLLILRALANSAPGFTGAGESISFDRVGSLAQYGGG